MMEAFTLSKILEGNSLARFGDGELMLIHEKDAFKQDFDHALAIELRDILWNSDCLVGIPHPMGARPHYWDDFLRSHNEYFNFDRDYVSSFISRPDEAEPVRIGRIWKDRDVILVAGEGSLTKDHLKTAKSVKVIRAPKKNAYKKIDKLEEKIWRAIEADTDLVILCAGATATCLAARLCKMGIQAVDLGYIGKWL